MLPGFLPVSDAAGRNAGCPTVTDARFSPSCGCHSTAAVTDASCPTGAAVHELGDGPCGRPDPPCEWVLAHHEWPPHLRPGVLYLLPTRANIHIYTHAALSGCWLFMNGLLPLCKHAHAKHTKHQAHHTPSTPHTKHTKRAHIRTHTHRPDGTFARSCRLITDSHEWPPVTL